MVDKKDLVEEGLPKKFAEGIMKGFTIDSKKIWIAVGCVISLILLISSVDIIEPDERGVAVTLGEISSDEPLPPGVVTHIPFVTRIERFSIVPKTYEVTFSVGDDGAITKDMQTVGSTVVVRYNYDENRIVEIVKKYRKSSIIEDAMKDCIKASLKEITGKYSIYDLVANQQDITQQLSNVVLRRMQNNYPISINSTTITNFDWAEDFDKMIDDKESIRQAAGIISKLRQEYIGNRNEEELGALGRLGSYIHTLAEKYNGGNWEYAREVREIFETINSMHIKDVYDVDLKDALSYKMPEWRKAKDN